MGSSCGKYLIERHHRIAIMAKPFLSAVKIARETGHDIRPVSLGQLRDGVADDTSMPLRPHASACTHVEAISSATRRLAFNAFHTSAIDSSAKVKDILFFERMVCYPLRRCPYHM